MSIGLQGENLIFLISQPRSGSTLSQQILGGHPQVQTVSEPWIMLHPIYALRSRGIEADYNASWARTALKEFLQSCPDGEATYHDGMRRMATYLYNQALPADKSYFLDKTPRYYLIIKELAQIFPKASFIILLRNPLAVLCSIADKWVEKDEWSALTTRLETRSADLMKAPSMLLRGIDELGDRCLVLHYEKLLLDPEAEVERICQHLGLDFHPQMIEYGTQNYPSWRFGDKKIQAYTKPEPENADKWLQALNRPQIWRLVNDYLNMLGAETIGQMGYSFEELQSQIEAYRPSPLQRQLTVSLSSTIRKGKERRSLRYKTVQFVFKTTKRWKSYQERLAKLQLLVQEKGLGAAATIVVQKLLKSAPPAETPVETPVKPIEVAGADEPIEEALLPIEEEQLSLESED